MTGSSDNTSSDAERLIQELNQIQEQRSKSDRYNARHEMKQKVEAWGRSLSYKKPTDKQVKFATSLADRIGDDQVRNLYLNEIANAKDMSDISRLIDELKRKVGWHV